MKNYLFILQLLLIKSLSLSAQIRIEELIPITNPSFAGPIAITDCNPDLNINPGQTCPTAPFVCDMDGYCADMQGGAWGNNTPFCVGGSNGYTLQNPNWFAFVANSTTIDLEIAMSNCTGSSNPSVQWGLYNQCTNLLGALICNGTGTGNGGVVNIVYNNASPGTIYYIVLDGFSGATCHYEVTVNSGIGVTLVAPALNTDLTGMANVCVGATVDYSFAGFGFATQYDWTLPDGANVSTTGPSTSVSFANVAPGTYQLCVTGTNECDDIGQSLCWSIEVEAKPELEEYGEVCPGSTFNFRGGNYPAGTYALIYADVNGVSCDTTINLHVTEYIPTTTPNQQIFICPGEEFAFIGGVPITEGQMGNILTFQDQHGCDSLVTYFVNELEVYGMIDAVPASLPCTGGTSTMTLNPNWGFFTTDTYGIEWYDSNDALLGTGNSIQITKPGYYYAIVTWYKTNNVLPGTNLDPMTLLCDDRFEITIPAENSTLAEPVVTGSTVLCAGEAYTFDTDTQTGTTSYNWIHTGGTVNSGGNNEHIELTYATPGQYEICVNAVDGCGPGPDNCFQIQVVPSATVDLGSDRTVCGNIDTLRAVLGGVPDVNDPNMQYIWTVVSGPDVNGVTFSAGNKAETQVDVVQAGTYTFQFGTMGRDVERLTR